VSNSSAVLELLTRHALKGVQEGISKRKDDKNGKPVAVPLETFVLRTRSRDPLHQPDKEKCTANEGHSTTTYVSVGAWIDACAHHNRIVHGVEVSFSLVGMQGVELMKGQCECIVERRLPIGKNVVYRFGSCVPDVTNPTETSRTHRNGHQSSSSLSRADTL
jgi:hypothetical protein